MILKSAFKDNSCLEKAMVMGGSLIAKDKIFSGFDHLQGYAFLDKRYAQYFWFTQSEIDYLLPPLHPASLTYETPEVLYDDVRSYSNFEEIYLKARRLHMPLLYGHL